MKFQGITVTKPPPKFMVLPHSELPGGQMVLQIAYMPDVKAYYAMFPEPFPKMLIQKAGSMEKEPDYEDKKYRKELEQYYSDLSHWIVLAAIGATDSKGRPFLPERDSAREFDGPQFETVTIDDRATLANWEQELKSAGFSEPIINSVKKEVNMRLGLNPGLIEKLTNAFLSSRGLTPAKNQ